MTAIITGAAAGIGRACMQRFAEAGVRVAMADIDKERIESASAEIRATGAEVIGINADVSSAEDCERLVRETVSTFGGVDILVANAGVQHGGSLLDTPEQDWQRLIDVNFNGTAFCCKAVMPAMIERGAGSIVIISSVNAIVGSAGMAVYDMSKAALLALTRNLAVEFGVKGIRSNAICPGNTITDFHIDRMAAHGMTADDIRDRLQGYGLLGRAAEPREIANAAWFLASEEASFITGHTLVVDGGFSITGRA